MVSAQGFQGFRIVLNETPKQRRRRIICDSAPRLTLAVSPDGKRIIYDFDPLRVDVVDPGQSDVAQPNGHPDNCEFAF